MGRRRQRDGTAVMSGHGGSERRFGSTRVPSMVAEWGWWRPRAGRGSPRRCRWLLLCVWLRPLNQTQANNDDPMNSPRKKRITELTVSQHRLVSVDDQHQGWNRIGRTLLSSSLQIFKRSRCRLETRVRGLSLFGLPAISVLSTNQAYRYNVSRFLFFALCIHHDRR
jgi:hypothetical protein